MPPKLRTFEKMLNAAGFTRLPGKGSHRKYVHSLGIKLSISGKAGSDAHPYQIRDVKKALMLVRNEKK